MVDVLVRSRRPVRHLTWSNSSPNRSRGILQGHRRRRYVYTYSTTTTASWPRPALPGVGTSPTRRSCASTRSCARQLLADPAPASRAAGESVRHQRRRAIDTSPPRRSRATRPTARSGSPKLLTEMIKIDDVGHDHHGRQAHRSDHVRPIRTAGALRHRPQRSRREGQERQPLVPGRLCATRASVPGAADRRSRASPTSGSCCCSLARRRPVYVKDIATVVLEAKPRRPAPGP